MSIAPISAVRVAGIRPAPVTPGSDPSEDGLDVEAVTELTLVQQPDQVAPTDATLESSMDPGRSPFARAAIGQVGAASSSMFASDPHLASSSGNARVATGFDRAPAADVAPVQREAFASPLARAMASYAR